MKVAAVWTVRCSGPGVDLPGVEPMEWPNQENYITPCEAYQNILAQENADIIVYVHDDVTVHDDDWMYRVLNQFDDPSVGVVGLGGATSLGHPDLYKRPYEIGLMARHGYRSNQTDWKTHGKQLIGTERVAVLDAFFMAVRRQFLCDIGGWPIKHLSHHGLDLWLACEAARHKVKTVAVGVNCTHHGGGTSTKDTYRNAAWLQGGNLASDHRAPHKWLYQNYRDVLPILEPLQ